MGRTLHDLAGSSMLYYVNVGWHRVSCHRTDLQRGILAHHVWHSMINGASYVLSRRDAVVVVEISISLSLLTEIYIVLADECQRRTSQPAELVN